MGLHTFLIQGQVSGCVLAFVLSLCFFVPIVIHEAGFQGHCILFSNGSRNESGHLIVTWATAATCHYSIIVGFLLLITSVFQGYRLAKHLYYATEGTFISSFADLVVNLSLMIMVLISAITITMGFKSWCDTIISGYQSCAGASVQGIDKQDLEALTGFYLHMGIAQFGAWSSWVCFVALTVFAVLRSCWHHQEENLIASMAKERQRLLKDDLDTQDS